MNYAMLVSVRQRFGDFDGVVEPLFQGELLVSRLQSIESGAQGSARQVLECQKAMTLGFVNLVDGRDIGVIQGGNGARFLMESGQVLAGIGQVGRQELERHESRELGVPSLVDDAHPAFPELGSDFVVGNLSAGDHMSSLSKGGRTRILTFW